MNDELEKRIREQEEWTFKDCLGLAAEFNIKTRVVVLMVLASGKSYIDGELRKRPVVRGNKETSEQ